MEIDEKELATLRRDASLWRKVKEIAKYNSCSRYGDCEWRTYCKSKHLSVCYHSAKIEEALEASDEPK